MLSQNRLNTDSKTTLEQGTSGDFAPYQRHFLWSFLSLIHSDPSQVENDEVIGFYTKARDLSLSFP